MSNHSGSTSELGKENQEFSSISKYIIYVIQVGTMLNEKRK